MRIKALDSVRGIASVVVFFYHFLIAQLPVSTVFYHPKLFTLNVFLLNGAAAVICFFVLSGFVLSFALDGDNDEHFVFKFYIKRGVRLYVPYLAGCALAAICLLLASGGALTNLRGDPWGFPSSWGNVLSMAFMLGFKGDTLLNGPCWTLFVEMQVSVLFPLLFLMQRRMRIIALMCVIALSLGCGAILASQMDRNWRVASTIGERILLTGFYLQFFAYGALLFIFLPTVQNFFKSLSKWILALSVVCVFVSLSAYYVRYKPFSYLVFSAAACWVIGMCASRPKIDLLLRNPFLLYLGRISFSLYLVHLPIIRASAILVEPRYGQFLGAIVGIVLTFAVTHLFNVFVERPSIQLGRLATA